MQDCPSTFMVTIFHLTEKSFEWVQVSPTISYYWFHLVPYKCHIVVLRHWVWDKLADISQTAFSNAFSLVKKHQFWLKVHWSLVLWFQLDSVGSGKGLALIRRQAIIWTDDGLVYWHIYVSLGLNELLSWWIWCDLWKLVDLFPQEQGDNGNIVY